MRRLTTRTRLLALGMVLVMVMATSCALERVSLGVGIGVGASPYIYHPGFLYHPHRFCIRMGTTPYGTTGTATTHGGSMGRCGRMTGGGSVLFPFSSSPSPSDCLSYAPPSVEERI
jgi:hypothetical protein